MCGGVGGCRVHGVGGGRVGGWRVLWVVGGEVGGWRVHGIGANTHQSMKLQC